MYPFFFFDPTMIIILPGLILAMWSQAKTQRTFAEWSKINAGVSAKEIAEEILVQYGVNDVNVEHVSGHLSDHYDPRSRTLRLSDATYSSTSVAAVAVAAHEAGHAIQHAKGYIPLQLRSAIYPVVALASNMWIFLIIAGIFFRIPELLTIGVWFFGLSFLFALVTLPVEFDASSRAVKILGNNQMLEGKNLTGARQVLNAAAMTYVSAAIVSLLQLIRLILISNSRR